MNSFRRSDRRPRTFAILFCAAFLLLRVTPVRAQSPSPSQIETVRIDVKAPAHAFPHFWEEMFGSGRAILSLRESYRDDLRALKKVTTFDYVRFHAVFHDEVGVYNENSNGDPVYNFSYVDQIYDGLLANGVRPFVEISFMPRALSSDPKALHAFWYKPNVAPPKEWAKWDDLIKAFARHLIERYGEDEVARWYFEVWNEPNIDFWVGVPKQATYFELYDHTARDLKAVSPRLRVGGPATAAAAWVTAFLKHTKANNVPVDFVSTHGYADDSVENLFHTHEKIAMDDRVCRAIAKVHNQIAAAGEASLPLMWTEWNVPSFGELHARDTIYVGAALANTVRECDGLVDMMSFWTFSDVFEESGPKREPFDGGFAPIAMGGIQKPGYVAFALLHRLGGERLANPASDLIVTRRDGCTLVIAAWNLVDPDRHGSTKTLHLKFAGVPSDAAISIRRADSRHGNTLATYRALDSPRYPSRKQVEEINRTANVAPDITKLNNGSLDLVLTPNALALVEVSAARKP
jgi:xylan 1,4-beta-xylosidase